MNFIKDNSFLKGYVKCKESKIIIRPFSNYNQIFEENFNSFFEDTCQNDSNSMTKHSKQLLILAGLKIYLLNKLDFIYRPVISQERNIDYPERLFFEILSHVNEICRKLTQIEGNQFDRYWNAMKKEFNLSSFTAAIDEMLNDVIFFTLDDLSEQFNNKAIRLVQKVSSKLQGLLNDKKIDENTLQTALKKYRYSFILIINLWVDSKNQKRRIRFERLFNN